jgi:hypothetical protein
VSRNDPFPLDGPPDDDPTAALLRDVLHRQADAVQPSPDGLRRIQAKIALQPRRVLPRRRRLHATPLLAAVAAVVAIAAAGTATVRAVVQHRAQVAAVEAAARIEEQVATREVQAAPAASLPVYVAGLQNGRAVLFREFRKAATQGVDAQVAEAVREAIVDRPEDLDYVQLFGPEPEPTVQARVTAQRIELDISPAPRPRAAGLTREDADVALQQLVWTATATASVAAQSAPAGSAVNARPVPAGGRSVHITLDHRVNSRLFDLVPLNADFKRTPDKGDDPRAKVWIIDPREKSQHARGNLDADGDAVALGQASVQVVLARNGVIVQAEVVPLTQSEPSGGTRPPVPGQRGEWRISGWDVRQSGRYDLVVSAPSASSLPTAGSRLSTTVESSGGGSNGARWWDSKTFTVE